MPSDDTRRCRWRVGVLAGEGRRTLGSVSLRKRYATACWAPGVFVSARRRATSARILTVRAGMSLQPLMRRNERSASSMPTPTHRRTILGSFQLVTRPDNRCTTEIIDSTAFVQLSERARRSLAPRRLTVNMSSRPSRRLAAAEG